jgi:hypothetical protein
MLLLLVVVIKRNVAYQEGRSNRRQVNGACMGKERKYTKFWWEIPKERDHSEDRGIAGRIRMYLRKIGWGD